MTNAPGYQFNQEAACPEEKFNWSDKYFSNGFKKIHQTIS
jgi:hypothetical protein